MPRLIIHDTLVHSLLNMAGGLDVFIEASASLRYQSLKEQKRAVKAFVEEVAVRIFVRARRVYLIAVESLHTAGTTLHTRCHQTLPPLERVCPARLGNVCINSFTPHTRAFGTSVLSFVLGGRNSLALANPRDRPSVFLNLLRLVEVKG